MNRFKFLTLLASILFCQLAHGGNLSQDEAVLVAEKFIAENGYTNSDSTKIKKKLDLESIEFTGDREKLLAHRRNSLTPKAIGVVRGSRSNKDGWSVAFDYVLPQLRDRDTCRIVTMDHEGTQVMMQHVEGIRSRFVNAK